jgi:hypothetical protein
MHYGVALTGTPTKEGIMQCEALGKIVASLTLKLNPA